MVVHGARLSIEWARDARRRAPAKDFFDALEETEQAKMLALFRRLADHGKIVNKELFKKLRGGLWEFKRFQLRFIGDFRPGGAFVIAIGLQKKKDRHSDSDLETADRILREDEDWDEDKPADRRRSQKRKEKR